MSSISFCLPGFLAITLHLWIAESSESIPGEEADISRLGAGLIRIVEKMVNNPWKSVE